MLALSEYTTGKERCLKQCRSPLSFFVRYYRKGSGAAWRLGLRHGMFCLGCCWALMLVMFGLGVGSLVKHYSYFLPCVIAAKIYVVLPENLRIFVDGKARKIRYTRLSNQNQAIWSAWRSWDDAQKWGKLWRRVCELHDGRG